jgi:hypothetical protein
MSIPWVNPNVFQVLEITGLLTLHDVVDQTNSPHEQQPAQHSAPQ